MRKETKHTKKVKKLIGICTMCAIIMTASTYAWFVGMKTVNVASFQINIATTEGLFLSMDGKNWSYELDVRQAEAYVGNTNSWAESGLVPMSTVGDMDSTSSTMKLYEKGSFTTTSGGFRLLTSRVRNTMVDEEGHKEDRGYVAFDLFVKNISGREYYVDNEPLNEEAIYLTTNSKVEVALSNGGEAGTGIENSVRVAFTQIGRVKGDTGSDRADAITGITCSNATATDGVTRVTGICRDAQIWEPNDKAHVSNALSWYTTSCLPRSGDRTDLTSSYGEYGEGTDKVSACKQVATDSDGHYLTTPTYAISRALGVDDNVDVYDGSAYNTYGSNTKLYKDYLAAGKSGKLVEFPYFTDTMKDLTSTSRPTFMTLAPNSITKLRVYVYIEGQDIDNYDFASLGKMISINFGFTKERYTEDDVKDYDGPSTDITPKTTATF